MDESSKLRLANLAAGRIRDRPHFPCKAAEPCGHHGNPPQDDRDQGTEVQFQFPSKQFPTHRLARLLISATGPRHVVSSNANHAHEFKPGLRCSETCRGTIAVGPDPERAKRKRASIHMPRGRTSTLRPAKNGSNMTSTNAGGSTLISGV